jgi:hypothetical protein
MGLERLIRNFSKTKIGFKILGCCHSYPDVFAIAGVYKNNCFFTEYYCFECDKIFSKSIDERKMIISFKEKVKKEGRVVYSTLEELGEIRKNVLGRDYYK